MSHSLDKQDEGNRQLDMSHMMLAVERWGWFLHRQWARPFDDLRPYDPKRGVATGQYPQVGDDSREWMLWLLEDYLFILMSEEHRRLYERALAWDAACHMECQPESQLVLEQWMLAVRLMRPWLEDLLKGHLSPKPKKKSSGKPGQKKSGVKKKSGGKKKK